MQNSRHSQITAALSRYDAIYPRLVKQKVKESGMAQRLADLQAASNIASKQTQAQLIIKYLNLQQRLTLIYTIAKSEIDSSPVDETLWQALTQEVDAVCASQQKVLCDSDLFLCCLFMLASARLNKHSMITQLLLNLVTKASNHLGQVLHTIQTSEEASELEPSLSEDEDLQAQMDFIVFVLRKGVVKYDLKLQDCAPQIEVIFQSATKQLQEFITSQQGVPFVQLTRFAPYAIWFEVLYDIFFAFRTAKKHPSDLFSKGSALTDLLKVTFDVLMIYKTNSQYYMITMGAVMSKKNDSQTGEQQSHTPAVRRMGKLFSEILDLLVSFMSSYLTSVPQTETADSVKIYEMLIKDKDGSSFTLSERLTMLNEMNFLFQRIDSIQQDQDYWQTIREGLADLDQACRKLALNILKSNLKLYQEEDRAKLNSKDQFEVLWTTFFDIFDTLESFGSHLTKAVWHRTELYYDFQRKFSAAYSDKNTKINPLEDMRMWLLVIYHRVASHNNIKVRRYVQKAILKREYITPHMTEFFFNEFIVWLNQCLIFKDVNNFTQFSKNAHTVLDFYGRYFQNESTDLATDLRSFFAGFSRNKSHSQMTLIALKTLSAGYPGDLRWVSTKEVRILLDMIDVSFNDQVLSGRYLCYKFISKMMANHITSEIEEWSTFFKLAGHMPLEFYSARTVFDDFEARKSVAGICTKTDKQLKQTLCEYLNTLFTVKAMSLQMPKFGKDSDLVLDGLCKMLLSFEDTQWLSQTLQASMEAFDSALQSTYLQNKLVEEKIRYFVKLCQQLYDYGTPQIQKIAYDILTPRVGPLLNRFWDQVCVPLSRDDELLVSEHDRIEACLAQLQTYADLAALAVKVVHLGDGRQENALEAFIKRTLTKTVQLTSVTYQPKSPWSAYLLQLCMLEILQSILGAYATGIKQNLKSGKGQIFIQDDLFVSGRLLLQNLIIYKINVKPNGNESVSKDQDHFMIELDLSMSKNKQKNSFNQWRILAHLLNIFQFDKDLRNELATVYNTQLTKKTLEFLDAVTPDYNPHIFFILRTVFTPTVLQSLQGDDYVSAIEEYQTVVRQCWALVKQQEAGVQAEELVEFMEFALNKEILEAYQRLPKEQFERVQKFHATLAKEMQEFGNKYWLLLRSLFNHLMFTFASAPHLMHGLESFVVGFGTTRECRSLDSEIKLYKLQMIIPEVIPKKYENLPMEQITYQGAYIRTMTLIIVEGIIRNYLSNLKNGLNSIKLQWTGKALFKIMLALLQSNLERSMIKSDQPFSEAHRQKLRTWQMLMVMCPLIEDPQAHPSEETLTSIEDILWPILKQNHLQNVRQYMECFTIKFVMRHPELTLREESLFYSTVLDTKAVKPQLSASLLLIAGFVLLHTDPATCTVFKRKIFDKLVGYCGSNSAHCRSIAQYFIIKLSEKEPALIGTALQPLMQYLMESKDVAKMKQKYQDSLDKLLYKCLKLEGAAQILTYDMNVEGEYIGASLVEELNKITVDVMTEYRTDDEIPFKRGDWWMNDLAERKLQENFSVTINEESSNYQRKILPWDHVQYDVSLQKRIFFQRRRNEIILCAALIDKVPNLAGLARTSEIMNASSLIINNASVVQLEQFKSISVTSEKWLPIYEVKEHDLLDYLIYQKTNGYKIVGIEQTANSVMLHNFKFPTRCVLLLGKEKEGIPQEYYSILDYCVEIPQFGLIRSLNVHVSGALCLWEYTKQHMPNPAPSTQTNQ